jgi:hypothetical protein
MKKPLLILAATVFAFALHAQDATPAPAPPPAPAASDDNDPASHQGYAPPRYEDLWTKSPFAVETPDSPVTDTADYTLVGVAKIGDVTYVSLVQKQNQAHLLLTSDKPLGDLKIESIDNKSDGIYANLTQNGAPLTLKLVQATPQAGSAPAPGMPAPIGNVFNPPAAQPGAGQNIPMPGTFNPSQARPLIRIRRPLIHVPNRLPNPGGEPPPAAVPAPGPGQPNSPPPPGAP